MNIKELLRKGLSTLFVRSCGAGIAFFLVLFFARWLGPADFGVFSLALTLITIVSVFSRWGLDQVLLKQVGLHIKYNFHEALSYAESALVFVFILSVILTIVIFSQVDIISVGLFGKASLEPVLSNMIWLVLPMSISYIVAEAYKGAGYSILSSYLQVVVPQGTALCLSIFFWYTDGFNLNSAIQTYLIGFWVGLVVTLLFWRKIFQGVQGKKVPLLLMLHQGWPMLLVASGALIMSWSDMVVLGLFSSESDLGIYAVASRMVMVSMLILITMNSITAPKYAQLFQENRLTDIAKLSQMTSFILLAVVSIPTMVFLVFPEWVLGWFGREYKIGSGLLMVLAIGQFINVSCGSVGYLLTMTGKEKVMRNIMLTTALINIVVSLCLVKPFGVMGVAYATAFSVILWNLWAMIEVKKHLGFWCSSFVLLKTRN